MGAANPRVTVSLWERDRGSEPSIGRGASAFEEGPEVGHDNGNQTRTLNELAARRRINDKNDMVWQWMIDAPEDLKECPVLENRAATRACETPQDTPNEGVAFGHVTENNTVPGQVYFRNVDGKSLNQQDHDLIASVRYWGDAPMLHDIQQNANRYQPLSSQAAIDKFDRMARDTDSMVSGAATCGTGDLSQFGIIESTSISIVGHVLTKIKAERHSNVPGQVSRDSSEVIREPRAPQVPKRTRSINDDTASRERKTPRVDHIPHDMLPTPRSSLRHEISPGIRSTLISAANFTPDVNMAPSYTASTNFILFPSPRSSVDGTLFDFTPVSPLASPQHDSRSKTSSKQTPSDLGASKRHLPQGYQSATGFQDLEYPQNRISGKDLGKHEGNSDAGEGSGSKELVADSLKKAMLSMPDIEGTGSWDRTTTESHAVKLEPQTNSPAFYNTPEVYKEHTPIKPWSYMEPPTTVQGLTGGDLLRPPAVLSKDRGFDVLDDSASNSDNASKPQHRYKTQMPRPARSRRQVGLARVKIDIVSSPRFLHSVQSVHESKATLEYETETDTSLYDEEVESESPDKTGSTAQNHSSGGSGGSSLLPIGLHTNPSDNAGEEKGSGANDEQNNRPRPRGPRSPKKRNQKRFACPYQAFDATQACFRSGPRNPNGGCTSCWRSFDSKAKVKAHNERAESCEARAMPATEPLMRPRDETNLEEICYSRSAEETWWTIFQLLIPDMQSQTLDSLKAQYSPYYFQIDSFMIPSLTFPYASFELGQPSAPGFNVEGSDYTALANNSNLNMDPNLYPMVAPPSHTLYVPLLDASAGDTSSFDHQPHESFATSPSGAPTLASDSNPRTSIQTMSTPVSTEIPTQASQDPADQSQLRRNYERLRDRHSQIETDISELQDSNRVARSDVVRADALIDELLALQSLPAHVYDKLSEVSDTLLSVKRRLR
ncbi:hypothetical protein FZEAL_547 [Fusarium zealandicum]|uniref:Uncharacterized protein n=1 Tax=Fusarium zealandicum TaxID=1053134 RepID=A0A8H4UV76_9HYPO|nr:hypothetical protein FZEAL_547 [Fusarium zealandicum]